MKFQLIRSLTWLLLWFYDATVCCLSPVGLIQDLLSVGDVSRWGDSSIVEVFIFIHPHLRRSPCVPDRRNIAVGGGGAQWGSGEKSDGRQETWESVERKTQSKWGLSVLADRQGTKHKTLSPEVDCQFSRHGWVLLVGTGTCERQFIFPVTDIH